MTGKHLFHSLFQIARPVKEWNQDKSLIVALGDPEAAATTTAYILVDLSDTTRFKHNSKETEAIVVDWIDFEADIIGGTYNASFGVVTEVDGSNGSVKFFHTVKMQKATNHSVHFEPKAGVNLKIASGVPEYLVSNHEQSGHDLYQTDVYLTTPAGSALPAAGDLVLLMEEITAGTINFTTSVGYHTEP